MKMRMERRQRHHLRWIHAIVLLEQSHHLITGFAVVLCA